MAFERCDVPLEDVDQPQHLVAMLHGLSGHANEWLRFEEAMVRHFGSVPSKTDGDDSPGASASSAAADSHQTSSSSSSEATENGTVGHHDRGLVFLRLGSGNVPWKIGSTLDGVDKGAARHVEEIRLFIADNPQIRKISLIGHSLGGLYGRYVARELHELIKSEEMPRLEFKNFVTLATPHMGAWQHSRFWGGFLTRMSTLVLRRTGHHLMLTDGAGHFEDAKDGDQRPLLVRMCDAEFLDALKAFDRCSLYSNIRHDWQVPFCTSAILARNFYRAYGFDDLPRVEPNSIVIDRERVIEELRSRGKYDETLPKTFKSDTPLARHLQTMLESLNSVPWHRYDCVARSAAYMMVNHDEIILNHWNSQTPLEELHAKSMADHIIENFVV